MELNVAEPKKIKSIQEEQTSKPGNPGSKSNCLI